MNKTIGMGMGAKEPNQATAFTSNCVAALSRGKFQTAVTQSHKQIISKIKMCFSSIFNCVRMMNLNRFFIESNAGI